MARNRQRARERKERLRRENVPGALDHASGEVEQAEASIVAGGGEPDTGVSDAELRAEAAAADDREGGADPDENGGRDRAEGGAGDGSGGGARSTTVQRGGGDGEAGAPLAGRGGSRLVQFIRASWAELQRVQWPDRRQVGQATAVVLGFVIIAGAFLGLADVVADEVVKLIL